MPTLADIDRELGIKPWVNHPLAYSPFSGKQANPVSTNGYGYPQYDLIGSHYTTIPNFGTGKAGILPEIDESGSDEDAIPPYLPPFLWVDIAEEDFYIFNQFNVQNLAGSHLLCRTDLASYNIASQPTPGPFYEDPQYTYTAVWSWFKYSTTWPVLNPQGTKFEWYGVNDNTNLRFQLKVGKNVPLALQIELSSGADLLYPGSWTAYLATTLEPFEYIAWECGAYDGDPYGHPNRVKTLQQVHSGQDRMGFVQPRSTILQLPTNVQIHYPATIYATPLFL